MQSNIGDCVNAFGTNSAHSSHSSHSCHSLFSCPFGRRSAQSRAGHELRQLEIAYVVVLCNAANCLWIGQQKTVFPNFSLNSTMNSQLIINSQLLLVIKSQWQTTVNNCRPCQTTADLNRMCVVQRFASWICSHLQTFPWNEWEWTRWQYLIAVNLHELSLLNNGNPVELRGIYKGSASSI